MLTAKAELQHYADCFGGQLGYKVNTTLARLIARMTADEAEAVLALLREAEADASAAEPEKRAG